jgi:D-beta-D-heptose 7-phosphate kinase/D-beta-D-heptose 1-phosphate adenosyltransferase
MENKQIFLTGTFDVIHRGHIELLKFAKSIGSFLTVAIDTDRRVKEKKGDDRPFHNQNDRRLVIESIRYVDATLLFDSDEELIEIVKNLNPDAWVAGTDWWLKPFPGKEYAKTIKYFDRMEPYSTTRILTK